MRRLFLAMIMFCGLVLFSATDAKAQDVTRQCWNTPVPVGWIVYDHIRDPFVCGGNVTQGNNVWLIARYDNRQRNDVLFVCNPIKSGAPGGGLPPGWAVQNTLTDNFRCSPNFNIQGNVVQITCLNCPLPTPTPTPVPGPDYEGWTDASNCNVIAGWVWNRREPNTPLRVDILVNGALFTQVLADQFRQDLKDTGRGDGRHNFNIPTPPRLKNSRNNTVTIKVTGTNYFLKNPQPAFNCPNPIDGTEFFVRQHYIDFLGREADASGLQFWMQNINQCGSDAACIDYRRVETSKAFFLSIEFQETGFFATRFYKAAFGRMPSLTEFFTDKALVSQGVVVGPPGWEVTLNANKASYTSTFVSRPAFQQVYGGLLNHEFVDRLLANAQISDSGFRDDLVNGLNSGQYSRATVMRKVVDNQGFIDREYKPAFVMMQYIGYLRRHPSDPPDGPAMPGYFFWLDKLTRENNPNEMVRAFLVSTEYRNRFGSDDPFPPLNGASAPPPAYNEAVPTPPCADEDGDGSCDDVDCNPYDPSVYPGAPTYCGWGEDRNCNWQDDYEECYGWYGWW